MNMLMATANSCRALAYEIETAAHNAGLIDAPLARGIAALHGVADLFRARAAHQGDDTLKRLGEQCRQLAREVADQGRAVGHQSFAITRAIRTLYGLAKDLADEYAREQAMLKPPAATEGRRTNVGDPCPKGQNPGVQKGGRRAA